MTIGIMYTCGACGLRDRTVEVEERSPEGDVGHWMRDVVGVAIGYDHYTKSPYCQASRLTNLKIPMDGREILGGPRVH